MEVTGVALDCHSQWQCLVITSTISALSVFWLSDTLDVCNQTVARGGCAWCCVVSVMILHHRHSLHGSLLCIPPPLHKIATICWSIIRPWATCRCVLNGGRNWCFEQKLIQAETQACTWSVQPCAVMCSLSYVKPYTEICLVLWLPLLPQSQCVLSLRLLS